MRRHRRILGILATIPLAHAACGGIVDGGSSWDEDWNDLPVSVCKSGAADHETIADAIAKHGDATVDLCPGYYPETFRVEGKAVWLRGSDAGATIIDGGRAGTALTVRGGGLLRLDGVTIQGDGARLQANAAADDGLVVIGGDVLFAGPHTP